MPRLPVLTAVVALAALAAPAAHAQSSGDRGSGWMEMDDQDSGRWGRGDAGRVDEGDRDEQSWRGHRHRWAGAGRDEQDDGGRGGKAEDGPTSRFGGGARFMLRAGDVRLAVQCGRGETMKDCVEATILLMDKARAQARPGAAGPDGPSSSPNPPATSPQQQ
jgi:hypothetical protein